MKKFIIVALLFITSLASAITPSQYVEASDGWRISVENNRLYMFAPKHYVYQYYPDTIALCDYRVVTDNVIQVTSVVTSDSVVQSASFSGVYDNSLIDSVRLIFLLPIENNYSITIGLEGIGELRGEQWLTYQTKNQDSTIVTLSKSDYRQWDYLFIELCTPIDYFPIGSQFLLYPQQLVWVMNYDFLMCTWNVNSIRIPLLSPDYFDQFQLQNEYMLLSNDTIKWRGMNFVRQYGTE